MKVTRDCCRPPDPTPSDRSTRNEGVGVPPTASGSSRTGITSRLELIRTRPPLVVTVSSSPVSSSPVSSSPVSSLFSLPTSSPTSGPPVLLYLSQLSPRRNSLHVAVPSAPSRSFAPSRSSAPPPVSGPLSFSSSRLRPGLLHVTSPDRFHGNCRPCRSSGSSPELTILAEFERLHADIPLSVTVMFST